MPPTSHLGGPRLLADSAQMDAHSADVRHIAEEIEGQIHTLITKVRQLNATGWQGIGGSSAEAVAEKLARAGKEVGEAVHLHGINVAKASEFYRSGEAEVKRMFDQMR